MLPTTTRRITHQIPRVGNSLSQSLILRSRFPVIPARVGSSVFNGTVSIQRASSLALQPTGSIRAEISHIPTSEAFKTRALPGEISAEIAKKASQRTSKQNPLLISSFTKAFQSFKKSDVLEEVAQEAEVASHAIDPMSRKQDSVGILANVSHHSDFSLPKPVVITLKDLLLAFETHIKSLETTLRSSDFYFIKEDIKALDAIPETSVASNSLIISSIKIEDALLERGLFQFLKTLCKAKNLSFAKLIKQISHLPKIQQENLKEIYAQRLILYFKNANPLLLPNPPFRSSRNRLVFSDRAMIGGALAAFLEEEIMEPNAPTTLIESVEIENNKANECFLNPPKVFPIRLEPVVLPTFVAGDPWTFQPIVAWLEEVLSTINNKIQDALATGSASIASVVNKMQEAIKLCVTVMHTVTQLPKKIKGAHRSICAAIALNFAFGFIFPGLRGYCLSPVSIALTLAFIYGLKQGWSTMSAIMLDWVSKAWETCREAMQQVVILLEAQFKPISKKENPILPQALKEESYELSNLSQERDGVPPPPRREISSLLDSRSGLFKVIKNVTERGCATVSSLSLNL